VQCLRQGECRHPGQEAEVVGAVSRDTEELVWAASLRQVVDVQAVWD
jgi:hypothetical protein